MSKLPEKIKKAWDAREGALVLTTVSEKGIPNAVYVLSVALYGDNAIVVADNYFDKTRHNILHGSAGSILFMGPNRKAYQAKGKLEYHTEGPIFDDMKTWNPAKHPGHAALALIVEEVYTGAERIF